MPTHESNKTAAEKAWEEHQRGGGQKNVPPPRPGDWWCPKCWPKVNNFAAKAACYRCGTPKPPPGSGNEAPSRPTGIRFGVFGDSLLQTRHDTAKLKKYRNFHHDFNRDFYTTFGNCTVEHEINPGDNLYAVTRTIANASAYDVICVGIGVQDLVDPKDYGKIVPLYPSFVDDALRMLAAAIMSKATQSMVWVGGPADFWKRPKQWDVYMERARNTLREAGIQVVPRETVNWVMDQMQLANDGMSISNIETDKVKFSEAWCACLHAAATDPTWGRGADSLPANGIVQSAPAVQDQAGWAIAAVQAAWEINADEAVQSSSVNQALVATEDPAERGRDRSRSPQPQKDVRYNPFAAFGYNPAC